MLGRVVAIFSVISIWASHPTVALAQSSIGSATSTQNQVEGIIGEGTRAIAVGGSVFQNERVRTGDLSQAQFVFLDRTNLGVGPKSEVTLNEFVYNPKRGSGKVVVNLGRGVFRFVTGLQRSTNYELRTPIATIGVRGTEFQVLVDDDLIVIALVRGALRIVTAQGRVVVLARALTTITIHADGQVDGPMPWTGPFTTFAGDVPFPYFPIRFAAVSPPATTVPVSPSLGGPPINRTAELRPRTRSLALPPTAPSTGSAAPNTGPGTDTAYWTGFYIGVNGGIGSVTSTNGYTAISPPLALGDDVLPLKIGFQNRDEVRWNNVIGGLQIGVNGQIGMMVLGFEADANLNLSNQSASNTVVNFSSVVFFPEQENFVPVNLMRAYTEHLEGFATARGRLGVALGDWLFYVTGGLAYAQLKTSVALTLTGLTPTPQFAVFSTRQTLRGSAFGGGVEAPLAGALTFKIEYLHLDFGHVDSTANLLQFGLATSNHITGNMVLGGINYKF